MDKTVLLVEDDTIIASGLVYALERDGYAVVRTVRYTSAVMVGVNLYRIAESADAESSVIEEVTAALDSYKDPQAAAVMFNPNYTAELRADAFTADYRKYVSGENTVKANVISFDDGTYRKILDLAGAKYGEAVLFNRWNYKAEIK